MTIFKAVNHKRHRSPYCKYGGDVLYTRLPNITWAEQLFAGFSVFPGCPVKPFVTLGNSIKFILNLDLTSGNFSLPRSQLSFALYARENKKNYGSTWVQTQAIFLFKQPLQPQDPGSSGMD